MVTHPRARRFVLAALLALAGCDAASDIDTIDTDEDVAPDVTGSYTLAFTPEDLCPGATDWLGATLIVSGPADALVFDFGDVSLTGDVDTAFAFAFQGLASTPDLDLDITGSGVVYTENDLWVLDGDLEIVATGVDSPCVATGTFQATQGS